MKNLKQDFELFYKTNACLSFLPEPSLLKQPTFEDGLCVLNLSNVNHSQFCLKKSF